MLKRASLKLLLILKACNIFAFYKYSFAIRDEEIFIPCNTPDVYFMDRFLNYSDLKFEFLPDSNVLVQGTAFWIKDLGNEHKGENKLSIHIFKKDRDKWSPTVYNIERADVCSSLFKSTEIWYPYFKDVSEENRKCPFFVGQELFFNRTAQLDLTVPVANFAG
ncbi:hypothetical protein DOY81_003236 [Sarcophaga bullata]|nr:hypothetical protein DOY81_003236 [Sarcophaga bullata]